MSLAGSRGGAPCGVWGNAPTVARATNSKEAANKGAGSEASLPVTLRSRRSAPQAALSNLPHIVAPNGRDHIVGLATIVALFRKQGISRLRARQGGFPIAPLTPSGAHPCLLTFIAASPLCPLRRLRGRISTRASLKVRSTQSRNGCREGRRPFAESRGRASGGGKGQRPSVSPQLHKKSIPDRHCRSAGDALIFPYLLESVSSFTQPRRVTSFA